LLRVAPIGTLAAFRPASGRPGQATRQRNAPMQRKGLTWKLRKIALYRS
jgi:hypothetical protein